MPIEVEKELSPGEQIFNILDGLSPLDKKLALLEAEERITVMYQNRI